MISTALRGAINPSQGYRGRGAKPDKEADASEELCPDELEAMASFINAGEHISEHRLHRLYERSMHRQISREEFTAVLTKIVGRSGSTPVDRMGDGEARRIDKENEELNAHILSN